MAISDTVLEGCPGSLCSSPVKMNSRPGSSARMRLTSPPPSRALLELQAQGLELAVAPNTRLRAPSRASGRSTPSDLDKPLPLEPFESKRRSSSVYSTDTTITNILRMYGEYRELDDIPPLPSLHQPQAYRDTVAPLLVKRLSLSPVPSQLLASDSPREAVSISSLRSAASHPYAVPSSKKAPSFTEFSRQLQQRRKDLISPLSDPAADLHRQAAYDQLAPPSPQVSSIEQSISICQTPPLPDAMSATVSDPYGSDLLLPPLGLSSSSLPSPPDWEKPAEFDPAQQRDEVENQLQHREQIKSWASQNWLNDDVVMQSPESSPNDHGTRKSFGFGRGLVEKEHERVVSSAETKHPGLRIDGVSQRRTGNSSARSSVQQGFSYLFRSFSRKSATQLEHKEWPEAGDNPPRERQLAIPATPYQVYGAEVFSTKLQKRQQKEAQREAHQAQQAQQARRSRRHRGKSVSLAQAYESGQNGIVEAVRKLTGKSSHKRQQKLKNSIILVRPAETTSTMNDVDWFTVDHEVRESWL